MCLPSLPHGRCISMPVSVADLSDAQLDAFITAKLTMAGVDLALLPTTFDAATGVPTRDTVMASLRSYLRGNTTPINTWRPPVKQSNNPDLYAQQAAAPLEYPSIVEAWTERL